MWESNGVAACAGQWTIIGFEYPDIASDGDGGAIITWHDYRNGTDFDIYAQRIAKNGLRKWAPNGIPICSTPQNQREPHIVPDGSGGAIIAWTNKDTGGWDIFAQRVSSSGSLEWPVDGVPVCTAGGDQRGAQLVSDGAGGAVIAWGTISGTYAQRVAASGAVQWRNNGVQVYLRSLAQYGIRLISDGSGGVIFGGYKPYSSVETRLFAQRIDVNGLPAWEPEGVPVSIESGLREDIRLVSDGDRGAIFAWQDFRGGEGDIYAMRLYGEAPSITVSLDIRPGSCPNPLNPKSKGVLPAAVLGTGDLDVSDIDASSIELEGVPPLRWSIEDVAAPVSSEDECACTEEGPDGLPDLVLKFGTPEIVQAIGSLTPGDVVTLTVTGIMSDSTEIEGTDCVVVVGGEKPKKYDRPGHRLLVRIDSDPRDPVQRIDYELPERAMVDIAVYDVSGRLVKRVESMSRPAGAHTAEWNASRLSSGVYFYRLRIGRHFETKKLILLR
jgi:hypothetical protein